jgi:hypothetical protein
MSITTLAHAPRKSLGDLKILAHIELGTVGVAVARDEHQV